MRRSKKKQKTEILVWRYSLQEKILQYITLDGRSLDLDIFFFHLSEFTKRSATLQTFRQLCGEASESNPGRADLVAGILNSDHSTHLSFFKYHLLSFIEDQNMCKNRLAVKIHTYFNFTVSLQRRVYSRICFSPKCRAVKYRWII